MLPHVFSAACGVSGRFLLGLHLVMYIFFILLVQIIREKFLAFPKSRKYLVESGLESSF